VKLRPECQRLCLKAPRAELLRQTQGSFGVASRGVELYQRVPAEERRMVADHLRPALPDQRCPRDCHVGNRERTPDTPAKNRVKAIIGRFATSMRPNPCRSHNPTHSLNRSWALIM